MSSIKCPLVGRMTIEGHYQSMGNALEAGFRLAQKAVEGGESLTDELLAELMEKENLWMHDPRSKDGLKGGGGSRERAAPSGSGSGSGDPCSSTLELSKPELQDLTDLPFDSTRCCRRHYNGGRISRDGLQAGAQCLNSLEGENGFCPHCEKRYQMAQVTDGDGNRGLDWHGSFSKPVREDPGWKKNGKLSPSGYPHWSKLSRDDEDPEEASAKEAEKAEKAAEKEAKKAEKEAKKEAKKAEKEVEKAEKEAEKETKKAEKEAQKVEKKPKKIKKFKKIKKEQVAALSQDSEDEMADMVEAEELKVEEPKAEEPKAEEPKAEEPKAKAEELEAKAEELEVDPTDIIEVDGTQYIHDKESDTIYTKGGEPVGNWVDGQPVWDNEETEELSAEESDEESDESDSED